LAVRTVKEAAWTASAAALALAFVGSVAARGAEAGELLYVPEGNRLRRVEIGTIGTATPRHDVLVENADGDPVRGRDVNGMICSLPDGRFVAGEDTGQPRSPAGWGVFERDGRQVGKLVSTSAAKKPDPYGCALDGEGRLFTTELGDAGFLESNGQLILWFPPYDGFPSPPHPRPDAMSTNYCKIATDIGTAGGVAIDGQGRVYVASSSERRILRFLPPFPTGPDAAGGCGARDATGAPQADRVERETFVRAAPLQGLVTYAGLGIAPNGHLYASSVLTGRIAEFDLDGHLVRMLLKSDDLLPPHRTGTPYGLAVDAEGTLYYADLDLVRSGFWFDAGTNGKVWRIRFANGEPLEPELVLDGLRFPDGLGVRPGDL